MTAAQEIVSGYVSDVLAVERELHQAFRRQKDDARVQRVPAVAGLLRSIEDTVDRHVERLSQTIAATGTSGSAVKKAVGGVVSIVGGIYERARQDDRISRVVRDDYAALSYAIVCYQMLHTTALALGDERAADTALRHLEDYAAAVVRLSDVIPPLVIQELAADGRIPADEKVAEEAIRHVHEAWAQT